MPVVSRLSVTHQHLSRRCSVSVGRAFTTASAGVDANPLLLHQEMPRFGSIQASHVQPAVEALLVRQEAAIAALEAECEALGSGATYDQVFIPLERLLAPLSYAYGLVGHLLAVKNSPELRDAHAETQPLVVAASSRISQSEPLYRAMKAVQQNAEAGHAGLDGGQMRAVEGAVRDAELGGVALSGATKVRFNQIKQRLAEISTAFSNNVLDSTKQFSKTVTDKNKLVGLPPSALGLAAQNAGEGATAENGPWKLTLDMPMLLPVMQFADDSGLREELYRANLTKASSGEHDNQPLIEECLQVRAEMAGLLGFADYASVSTAEKMAQTPAAVIDMHAELRAQAFPAAVRELEELRAFAVDNGGPHELRHWDMSYWSEKRRKALFSVSDEEVKPYLPLPAVLQGLFGLAEKLFGVTLSEAPASRGIAGWHEDVSVYEVKSTETGEALAVCFLDPYARPAEKRGGAWMNSATPRSKALAPPGQEVLLPVCYLVCNQTPPVGDEPSLMTYSDAETLFHEFGHGLQWMLTETDNGLVAGINGVEWDAVELPSQFMENWLYSTYEVIEAVSGHVDGKSGPLPAPLWEKLVAARTYMAGTAMLRQLFFGMTDMQLHARPASAAHDASGGKDVLATFRAVAEDYTVIPPLPEDRFLCSFGHIFAGGYSAGYYSYKWAEVLSADAFGAFEEAGLYEHGLDHVLPVGRRFRKTVLGMGGSAHPMEVFKEFRGREPSVEALLRHNGLAEAPVVAAATSTVNA
jgi:oligopeptidase A